MGMSNTGTLHRIPTRPALVALAGGVGRDPGLVAGGLAVGPAADGDQPRALLVPVFLPNCHFYAPVLSRVPEAGNSVWLTIDDGPGPETRAVLDLLDRHQARATFFLVGERALAQPEQEILRRGHDLGNHSHSHPQARFWLGPAAMPRSRAASMRCRRSCWYRSVVGMTNPFVAPVLKALGLVRVGWSARGYDGVGCTPEACCRGCCRPAPGAIVLLHEGVPTATTWRSSNAAAGAGRAAEGAAAGSVTPGPGRGAAERGRREHSVAPEPTAAVRSTGRAR